MAKKSKKIAVDGSGFGGGMADLLKASGLAPQTGEASDPAVEDRVTPVSELPDARDWRAQVERKGRKGKTVTRLYGVSLSSEQTDALCRALGKALGCRAFVEDNEILVQGKHAERALKWLAQYKG